MKSFLVIIIVFLSLSGYSQGYIKGLWEGSFKSDTLVNVKLNVLEQSPKRVFAILRIDQTLVGLYDSCFNGNILHLKTDRKEMLVRNEKISEREINQKKKKTILFEEVSFSASLDKNRLVGKLKLDKKEFQLTLTCNDLQDVKPYEISRIFNPYYHEEIQCRNQKDNVVLAGTLTLPKKKENSRL